MFGLQGQWASSVLGMVCVLLQLHPGSGRAHPSARPNSHQDYKPRDMGSQCLAVPEDVLWLRLNPVLYDRLYPRPPYPQLSSLSEAEGGSVNPEHSKTQEEEDEEEEEDTKPNRLFPQGHLRGGRTFGLRHTRSTAKHSSHKRSKKDKKQFRRLTQKLTSLGPTADTQSIRKVFRKKQWSCEFEPEWRQMAGGIFPTAMLTGRCRQSRCMFGFYNCVPVTYPVPVLRRDPELCNPLPTLGQNSTYEEMWHVVTVKVTVGCECAQVRS